MQIRDGESDGPLRRALAGMAAMLLVAAACSGTDAAATETAAPATTVATTTTAPPPTTNTTSPPHRIDLAEDLPRTATYAYIEVTVEAAAIARIEPKTFGGDNPLPSEETFAFLTLHVVNESDTDGAIINPSPFSLLVDGNPQAAPIAVTGRANLGLGVRAESDAVVAFAVPEGTAFESLELVIAQPDRIPTILPLVGETVDTGFPVDLEATGEGPAQGGASGCNQSLDITVFGGEATIDLLDTDAAPSGYGSRRANLGERFISLELQILNNGGSRCGAGATNYSSDSFSLLVDGVPRQPVTFLSGAIAAGTATDVSVNFVYPADATTIEFTVGDEDGTLFALPIDVSAVLVAPGE